MSVIYTKRNRVVIIVASIVFALFFTNNALSAPITKKDSVKWSGDIGSYTTMVGEHRTLNITAEPGTDNSGNPFSGHIFYIVCADDCPDDGVEIDIEDNKVKIFISTNKVLLEEGKTLADLPYELTFKLTGFVDTDGSSLDSSGAVYGSTEIPSVTITQLNCDTYKDADLCDDNQLCAWPKGSKKCIAATSVSASQCKKYNNESTPQKIKTKCASDGACFWWAGKNRCESKFDGAVCFDLPKKLCDTAEGSAVCKYDKTTNKCQSPTEATISEEYKPPSGYKQRGGILPNCAFAGTCRDINDLVVLLINIGKFIFSIVGTLAFVMFIFGGFSLITSFGNPEKVKKGIGVLFGAAIGLIIVFGAYILVDFLLDALQVQPEFRGLGDADKL